MRFLFLATALCALAACGTEPAVDTVETEAETVTELAEPTLQDVQIDATGEACGGFTGIMCPSGYYCMREAGQCLEELDGAGTCQPSPEMCTQQYEPVCGCDGQTYSNDCEAATAGVSVAGAGECAGPDLQ